MKTWRYSITTNTLWTSFDYGTVEAETHGEATAKAIEILDTQFKLVNDALRDNPKTKNLFIAYSKHSIEVEEKTEHN